MRPIWMIALLALAQSAAFPADAGSPCADVGPTRNAICVCSKSSCWIEPGNLYRFDALFGPPKALTGAGVVGLWQPVRRDSATRWRKSR